jgi:hypothetical protein
VHLSLLLAQRTPAGVDSCVLAQTCALYTVEPCSSSAVWLGLGVVVNVGTLSCACVCVNRWSCVCMYVCLLQAGLCWPLRCLMCHSAGCCGCQ